MRSASLASLALLFSALTPGGAGGEDAHPAAPAAPPVPAAVVVGLVPSGDALVDRDLLAGLELALRAHPGAVEPRAAQPPVLVRVGTLTTNWGSAAQTAVDLVRRQGALALVGPPLRATGHLLAQVGTRLRIPVLSTSGAPSVTGSGSPWIVRVVPAGEARDGASALPLALPTPEVRRFAQAYSQRHGRVPTAAAAAGYDAGQTLRAALRRSEGRGGVSLRDGLLGLSAVSGAQEVFRLSAGGQREAAATTPPEQRPLAR